MKTLPVKTILIICFFSILLSNCKKDDNELPYSSYISLASQTVTNAPTENILLNELDLSITWQRLDEGKYIGVLSTAINLNKTVLSIQLQETDKIATGGFKNADTIQLDIVDRYNVYDTKDEFTNAHIEIKKFE